MSFEKKTRISSGTDVSPRIIGAERNMHGTRLCHRITCKQCHKVDYVAKRLQNAKHLYCRSCAEKLLNTFESGRVVAEKKADASCGQCHKVFLVPAAILEKKNELLCPDCYRGFAVWRGKGHLDPLAIVSKKGSNTLIRKKSP